MTRKISTTQEHVKYSYYCVDEKTLGNFQGIQQVLTDRSIGGGLSCGTGGRELREKIVPIRSKYNVVTLTRCSSRTGTLFFFCPGTTSASCQLWDVVVSTLPPGHADETQLAHFQKAKRPAAGLLRARRLRVILRSMERTLYVIFSRYARFIDQWFLTFFGSAPLHRDSWRLPPPPPYQQKLSHLYGSVF